ncbi:MAG: hypothetical protein V4474_04620 [Patescibacteria group bacterium]
MISTKIDFDNAWERAVEAYRKQMRARRNLTATHKYEIARRVAADQGLAYVGGVVGRLTIEGIRDVGNDFSGFGNPNHIRACTLAWDAHRQKLWIPKLLKKLTMSA